MRTVLQFVIMILIGAGFVACNNTSQEAHTLVKPEWATFYEENQLNGTFVLYNPDSHETMVYNELRADSQFLPASTFKIFNSLVSLEEQVVDERTVIPWDSVERFVAEWNQDMYMELAFPYSCVWFYQELARRVGKERMQLWLDTISYGNRTMGAPIDLFWLEGGLKISAHEQIQFLDDLYHERLAFSNSVQQRIKKLMLTDSTADYCMYAKTGWGMRIERQVGWYVGFVETNQGKWIFANNIEPKGMEDLQFRKSIVYDVLKAENIIPSE